MKVWAIIWRTVWVIIAVLGITSAFESCASGGEDIIMNILGFCLTCILINVPIYIRSWVLRDEVDDLIAFLEWELYPIRSLVMGILLAPVLTAYAIVQLAIQVIGLITGRYDV